MPEPAPDREGAGTGEPELATMKAFLEVRPPGSIVDVSDVMAEGLYTGGSRFYRLNTPPVHIHCGSPHCAGLRYFRFLEGDRDISRNKTLNTFITYQCSNCRAATKSYSLHVELAEHGDLKGQIYKFGEMPPFGPMTPPRLLKLLGDSQHLFMKGRRCESQGLGIGAFVYYRRVVEDQRFAIIGEITRVARILNASAEVVATLEKAQKETQFSRSIELVKDAIPESLRIQGHNPLMLLHDNLSTGLHAKSDDECLEIAQAVRIVLAELAERLSAALKDQAELSKAVGKLLNKS